jgi:urocanate hydratase
MRMLSITHQKKRNPLADEKKLALKNALRYFEPQHHEELIQEFVRS